MLPHALVGVISVDLSIMLFENHMLSVRGRWMVHHVSKGDDALWGFRILK